ncbi:MAG: CPBP family intramembrane metalloprotease [Cyanobacteria bacterium SZAS-4]|nr:CPBP family intramembrane metalloprotease [Cyanobacteria bacterium SZAS-4]
MQTDGSGSAIKSIFSKDIILLTILGLALLIVSVCLRDDAFPAASLDLKVNKKDAVKLAQAYAITTGFYLPRKIISSAYFNSDSEASTFLEYEYPLAAASNLMRNEIPIWYWKVHFVDDKSEELQVAVGVNGKLHSFERELNRDKSIPSVSHEVAQKQIFDFTAQELRIPVYSWKLISEQESTLPKRTDHSFIWEDQQRDYKGAHMRISATVSGDKISKFHYFLHVPESFEQKFKWLRAQNRALANIPIIIVILFALSLPVLFLRNWTKNQLRIKFAVTCGLLGTAVNFISSLNNTATIIVGTSNWSMDTFLAKHFIDDISSALMTGAICTIFFGAIEAVYRHWYTKQLSCELLFTQTAKALRSISVAKSAVLGTAIFGITTGYQVIFFLIAKHYGLWSPLAVHDRAVVDNFCPAWHAMSVGIKASTLEEFGFRIFMLIAIQQVTKSFWLANTLQAAIWSFGHCSYPVEPPYARGIELGILGIFYGWVMRRYGVLSLIMGHYAFDVYCFIQTLFGSHDIIDRLSAYITMTPLAVLPIASIALICKMGAVPDSEVSNEATTVQIVAHAPSGEEQGLWPPYKPINRRQILLACVTAGLAASTLALPKKKLGGEPPIFRVDHERAISITRSYFEKLKFNIKDLQATAWMSDDTNSEQMQYVSSHAFFDEANRLEKLIEPRLVWNVRLFKPGDPNIFFLKIGPNGDPVSSSIALDENAVGAKLTQSEATALANDYLSSIASADGGRFTIFDTSKLEHPNRTDYTFVAENPSGSVGRARFQIYLKVIGDNVSDMRRYWSLPDRTNPKYKRGYVTNDEVWVVIARLICALIVLPNIGYWIFSACKKQAPNKLVVSVAVIVSGSIAILQEVNYMSRVALWTYHPTEPLDTHLLQVALTCLTRVATNVSIAAVLAAIVSSSYSRLFISVKSRELLKSAKPQIANYRIWCDAILIGLTAALVSAGWSSINSYLTGIFSTTVALTRLRPIAFLEQSNAAMASIMEGVNYGLLFVFLSAAILRWSDFYANQQVNQSDGQTQNTFSFLVPVLIAITICVLNVNAVDQSKMFCNIGTMLGMAGSLYLVLEVLGNRNLIACFFAAFFLLVGRDIYHIYSSTAAIHPVDLMVLCGIILAPFLWVLLSLLLGLIQKKPAS